MSNKNQGSTTYMTDKNQGTMTIDANTALQMVLAIQGGSTQFKHVDIQQKEGIHQIILPQGMSENEGIKHLERQRDFRNTKVEVSHRVECFPLDGARALSRVMKERYGWVDAVTTPVQTMFGTKEVTPEVITVEVSKGEYEQVLWGSFVLPGIKGRLSCSAERENNRQYFCIGGEIIRKDENEIKELADLVRQEVLKNSIYKRKAIILKVDEEGMVDFRTPPSFMDISKTDPDALIFPEEVEKMVHSNIFTPIEHTQRCRQMGVSLKRGILLYGKYGTGKTLTAAVTAKKSTAGEWTFIYLDQVAGIVEALHFARMFQPAVIFAEDLERAIGGTERTSEVDSILNTIDGVSGKDDEVIVIFTSNHPEKVHRAMLRPGRLDAVIEITPPDADASIRIVRSYGRDAIPAGADLTLVGQELQGMIPAVIAEVVRRASLTAIYQRVQAKECLTPSVLLQAAKEMRAQLQCIDDLDGVPDVSMEEQLGRSVKTIVDSVVQTPASQIKQLYDRTM